MEDRNGRQVEVLPGQHIVARQRGGDDLGVYCCMLGREGGYEFYIAGPWEGNTKEEDLILYEVLHLGVEFLDNWEYRDET